jgi:FixJ family two-component response regulator
LIQSKQVFVVDDDASVRTGLCRLLRSAGYEPEAFGSAREFMEQYRGTPGCLLLDISMPDVNGLELQQWLSRLNSPLPIVFLTGHGDIPTSVQAMKRGAVDLLTKPVSEGDLLRALEEGLRRDLADRATQLERYAILARLATLTPREREVFDHIVLGQLNKQVAADLGTVEKTIKVHRGRVMEKMGVRSVAELARLAERVGAAGPPPAISPPIDRLSAP